MSNDVFVVEKKLQLQIACDSRLHPIKYYENAGGRSSWFSRINSFLKLRYKVLSKLLLSSTPFSYQIIQNPTVHERNCFKS